MTAAPPPPPGNPSHGPGLRTRAAASGHFRAVVAICGSMAAPRGGSARRAAGRGRGARGLPAACAGSAVRGGGARPKGGARRAGHGGRAATTRTCADVRGRTTCTGARGVTPSRAERMAQAVACVNARGRDAEQGRARGSGGHVRGRARARADDARGRGAGQGRMQGAGGHVRGRDRRTRAPGGEVDGATASTATTTAEVRRRARPVAREGPRERKDRTSRTEREGVWRRRRPRGGCSGRAACRAR
jgi:hypothetical protein